MKVALRPDSVARKLARQSPHGIPVAAVSCEGWNKYEAQRHCSGPGELAVVLVSWYVLFERMIESI